MQSERASYSLDQLYDFSSGLSKPRSAFGRGHPFLSFKDVFYNSAVPAHLNELVDSTAQERAQCSVRRGDVFLTRTSETMDELGMSSVALHDVPDATFNGFTKRLRPKSPSKVVPEYARYYFRAPGFRQAITAMSSMSTRASLNNEMLSRLSITLPSLDEQAAIGHILGLLDDKIELNRRMSETLEAIARTLFKSWFVDFEPVRAKIEGRDDGLSKPIADLFPARFVDSELGEIPEGWHVGRLEDALVLQRGFDLPANKRNAGAYPVLAASGPNGTHDQFMVRGPGVTTGRSGVLGKVFYVAGDFWPLNTSLWVREFRWATPSYALHLLRGIDFAQFNAGSAVPTLNRNHVHGLPTLLPPAPLVEVFEQFATRCLQRQSASDNECAALGALRDSLLPKLISGEVRVSATAERGM
jgi:type I restriction enzyme S subunit